MNCAKAPGPITAQVGHNFTLSLESNQATGYEWQLAAPLEKNRIELLGVQYLGRPERPGGKSTETWTFKAVGAGKAKIQFKYVRSWQKNPVPASTASFLVRIVK